MDPTTAELEREHEKVSERAVMLAKPVDVIHEEISAISCVSLFAQQLFVKEINDSTTSKLSLSSFFPSLHHIWHHINRTRKPIRLNIGDEGQVHPPDPNRQVRG